MRHIIVADDNHGRPAESHFVLVRNLVLFAISHFDGEGNALSNRSLNFVSGHCIEKMLSASFSDKGKTYCPFVIRQNVRELFRTAAEFLASIPREHHHQFQ